jgi:hypothetical protein
MFTVVTCPSGTSLSGTDGMTQISNPGGQHTGICAVRRMPASPRTQVPAHTTLHVLRAALVCRPGGDDGELHLTRPKTFDVTSVVEHAIVHRRAISPIHAYIEVGGGHLVRDHTLTRRRHRHITPACPERQTRAIAE